jgi:hypothetical protein
MEDLMANTYSPFGFKPTRYLNGAAWNGQTNPYPIASGYEQSIFTGDFVIINGTNRTIQSLQEAAGTSVTFQDGTTEIANTPILGVFMGCSYRQTPAENPVDPSSPGRPYWPGGTVTLNSEDAVAFIMDDPQVVGLMQMDDTASYNIGSATSNGLNYTTVGFITSGTAVQGNLFAGTSNMYINGVGSNSTPTANNIRLLKFGGSQNNQNGANYNIWEVTLQNPYFGGRAVA